MLYRFRKQVQVFDNALMLTRGNPIGPMAVFNHLNPNHYVFTGILRVRSENALVVGQMHARLGEPSARISFVLPDTAFNTSAATAMFEALAWEAGNFGAIHLLGEVDEHSNAFAAMRKAGFSVYGRQQIWRFSQDQLPKDCDESCWEPARSRDDIAIKNLYHTLVPPLVQGAEPLNGRSLNGLVYKENGEVMAYAEGRSGPHGVYLSPIIHPDVSDPHVIFRDLLHSLSPRARRPVYIAVRSYQSWFEAALDQLNGEFGPRQALMIKHMVHMQRVPVQAGARAPVLEKQQPIIMAGPKADATLSSITREDE